LDEDQCIIILNQTCREIEYLKNLKGHKNVVNLFDVFASRKEKSDLQKELKLVTHYSEDNVRGLLNCEYTLHLVMEHGGIDLEKYLKTKKGKGLPESEVRHYLKQIVNAFRLMRSLNIVHRDLKLGNILVRGDGIIKIVDFGFGKKLAERESTYTKLGTPLYAAPELMQDSPYNSTVDMWSLGVVLFKLLAGFACFPLSDKYGNTDYPNDPVNRNALYKLYSEGHVVRLNGCSNEINEFIAVLLKPATERISWQDFFAHPVLQDTISFPYTPATNEKKNDNNLKDNKKDKDKNKKLKKIIEDYKMADSEQKRKLEELKLMLEELKNDNENMKMKMNNKIAEVESLQQENEILQKEKVNQSSTIAKLKKGMCRSY